MKMFVAGHWVDKPGVIEVKNFYDGALIDTVPRGDGADVERPLGRSFGSCYSPFANRAKALLQPCQFAVPIKPVDCRM